jgi:hypothetical protein
MLAVCVCGVLRAADELTPATYDTWRDYALPKTGEENWRKIPWLPTFYEGVSAGQKANKPLLIWVMNGHPLACT